MEIVWNWMDCRLYMHISLKKLVSNQNIGKFILLLELPGSSVIYKEKCMIFIAYYWTNAVCLFVYCCAHSTHGLISIHWEMWINFAHQLSSQLWSNLRCQNSALDNLCIIRQLVCRVLKWISCAFRVGWNLKRVSSTGSCPMQSQKVNMFVSWS